ncbi:hypothetical protein [Micromonospora gifhornensis]|uniref:hypothetical protein n=1 Tax=Micromonospora gifhornensis TaxID=84594 RepID=UPI003D761E40
MRSSVARYLSFGAGVQSPAVPRGQFLQHWQRHPLDQIALRSLRADVDHIAGVRAVDPPAPRRPAPPDLLEARRPGR